MKRNMVLGLLLVILMFSLVSCEDIFRWLLGDDRQIPQMPIYVNQPLYDQYLNLDDKVMYYVSLDPNRTYAVEIPWMTGDVDLRILTGPYEYSTELASSIHPGTTPDRCTYLTGYSQLYILVDNYAGSSVSYDIEVEELINPPIDGATGHPELSLNREYANQWLNPLATKSYVLYIQPGYSYQVHIKNPDGNYLVELFDGNGIYKRSMNVYSYSDNYMWVYSSDTVVNGRVRLDVKSQDNYATKYNIEVKE